jgi:hypothetical protein
MLTSHPDPAAAEVYAALWLGALLVASGQPRNPLPPPIEELARGDENAQEEHDRYDRHGSAGLIEWRVRPTCRY